MGRGRGDIVEGGVHTAEDSGGCGARVGVDELAGDDAVPEEGLPVCEVRVRLAGVGGGVEPEGGGVRLVVWEEKAEKGGECGLGWA